MQPLKLIEQIINRENLSSTSHSWFLFAFFGNGKKPHTSNWFSFSSTHSLARFSTVFSQMHFCRLRADLSTLFAHFSPAFCHKT